MIAVRCPRCGAELKPLAELEKLARSLARGARRPDVVAARQADAQRLADALSCHARNCIPPRLQRQWRIYRGIRGR
jgi:hypothetical protein